MKKITRRHIQLGAIGLVATAAIGAAVAGVALADPLGSQARVSAQGPGSGTGNSAYDAVNAAIAYNGQRNQYLTVWRGDTATAGEDEIWARIIAADGSPTGGIIRVSNMGGPAGTAAQDATAAKVAYNSRADEYLVVWSGDHELDGLATSEDEIWGRRISGDGTFASDQFRISEMGTDGDNSFEAIRPDVVYNPDLDQYVVVWYGDQPTPGDGDLEIWARRINPDGTSIDADEVRLTDIGPTGGTDRRATVPRIAYDPDARQYLVVFEADDGAISDKAIHGQRLGQGLGQVGANDFPISTTAAGRDAFNPSVAYNPIAKRFMTAWQENKLSSGEFEIYGQFIDGTGAEIGADDFRISNSGPDGDAGYDARDAAVVSNDRANEFLVAWEGADDQPALALGEEEIFAQRYTGAGVPVGTPEVRVSTMGPDGDQAYDAKNPTGAYNSTAGEYLLGWEGDDNAAGLLDNEFEVYVRRHGAGTATAPFPANCKPVPPRGTPNEVQVPNQITAAYLKTNQRTGAATVRRANALDAWMNAGIVDKDLCGGSVSPADLDSNLTPTSGPLGPTPSQAEPRKVNIPPAGSSNATFRANAIQMCINQRVYQAGISRANALRARLDSQLTGGDLTDGTLTQSRLRQDLTITAAVANPTPPAASKTDVKAPTRAGCDSVKFTTQQASINRRIAIQSVVRINEVLDEVNGGLDDANFKDGTITKVDFAPGVTP